MIHHRQNLTPLLQAQSVAIVGLSKPDRFGGLLFTNLQKFGYQGSIYGVNPRYDTLFDQPCYPSLCNLPKTPECAILAVPNQHLLQTFQEVASCNIPAAVIFASAYSKPVANQLPLQHQLTEIAQTHNIAVCGPNCMGFVSLAQCLPISGYHTNPNTPTGNITFITHSGSVWEIFLQNQRSVAFNYIISSGNEMVTSIADYMQFALTDPSTRVISLFLETVRDPQTFTSALAEAAERDISVVALKTGSSQRGAQLAQAHSGALAGEDATYDALFAHYGVSRVKSLDEMMDTLELFATGMRPQTHYITALLDSGGQQAMLVDLAETEGVEFAPLSQETQTQLSQILEPGLDPINPLDAWGTDNNFEEIYAKCCLVLNNDPHNGLTLFAVDLYPIDDFQPLHYPSIVSSILDQLPKPLAWLIHLTTTASRLQLSQLRQMGIPVLLGTETGLRAVRHILTYTQFQYKRMAQKADASKATPVLQASQVKIIRQQLQQNQGPLDEFVSKQILQQYGLSIPIEGKANSLPEVLQVAKQIGYPIALKTANGDLHKTEHDGVRLNLAAAEQLTAAYQDLKTRLGPQVLVQQMVPAGLEFILGIVKDPQFGLLLTLGTGGIFVEVFKDIRLILLPTTPDVIRKTLLTLRGVALLPGVRGHPPANIEAIVSAAMSLASLATDIGDLITEIDINPLIALPDKAIAVDALIIPNK